MVGKHGDALKIHITSGSASGTANETLLKFLSEKLEVERKNLEIAAGLTSTEKMVIVVGISPVMVEKRLLQ